MVCVLNLIDGIPVINWVKLMESISSCFWCHQWCHFKIRQLGPIPASSLSSSRKAAVTCLYLFVFPSSVVEGDFA